MSKTITTKIYSNRFKDLCNYMHYAWFDAAGVAGQLTCRNTSKLVEDVNGEIQFNYSGWNDRINYNYNNAKILEKFALELKSWLVLFLHKDAYNDTLSPAERNDIYTKSSLLNKKSTTCSPSMKNDWENVKTKHPEIEGECPTVGEILMWFDYLIGHNTKTMIKNYGQKMIDELIGSPANPFVIEFEKNYRVVLQQKHDKWRAARKELEEKLNAELKEYDSHFEQEMKKFKEEHDAQLAMLKLVG